MRKDTAHENARREASEARFLSRDFFGGNFCEALGMPRRFEIRLANFGDSAVIDKLHT